MSKSIADIVPRNASSFALSQRKRFFSVGASPVELIGQSADPERKAADALSWMQPSYSSVISPPSSMTLRHGGIRIPTT